MGQGIEIPVSLGLQSAKNLVDLLKEMLKNSVKEGSSAFKDIERFLNKISGLADSLKGKMGEAFKTSSSSKLFLRLYELLFDKLAAAKEKFTSLGLNDIAFSETDTEFVDLTMEKIKQLQQEITNLEKGKIGNLFDNSSIEGAEKVKSFVESLGRDINSLTFSGLSAMIAKELGSVQELIGQTEGRINSLKTQVSSLSGDSLTKLSDKMLQAILGAADSNATTFKTEKIIEYRQALEEFYKSYSLFTETRTNKDPTGGLNVGTFLSKEAESIAKGIEAMKERFAEYEDALTKIEEIRAKGLSSTEAKGLLNDIAKLLGIDFNAMDYRTLGQAASKLTEFIEALKGDFKNAADFDKLGKEMLANLTHVFDSVDLNKVINVSNLKNQLTAILKEAGVDVNDSTIALIFNSITKNINTGDFMSAAIALLEAYRQKKLLVVDETVVDNNKLKESEENLKNILETVNTLNNVRNDSIKLKKADIEDYTADLRKMIEEYNKVNGTNLKLVDDTPIKQGKSALDLYITSLSKLESKLKALSNVLTAITRWMGFYQVLNLTKRAVNDMKLHILELDTVMTKIAVVTNFSQDDLWNLISLYSEIARQYGVAIKGVYEVSQIYYQQGLNKGDVMGLTTETLKMARIAGIDYATAADYMTTAIRGFKLEMSDAAHVTDVFSNLAAHTASSTEELATAISKTAASAASVGASFESTSAMMATMIATTRESATNIGTALKSIISRYGEMKANPEGLDSEGESYSLNKVDKALQSIGISIHDVNGLFRNFDDVVLELAEAWDSVDTNTLRYIATVMAGNRQLSRFLALVSNVEEYKRALELANNSEDSGEIQTLKTLDSIDAKIEKMKVTILEFYTSSGILDLYKGVLDTITNVISAANDLPKMFGKFPALALALGMLFVNIIKNALKLIIASVSVGIEQIKGNTHSVLEGMTSLFALSGREHGKAYADAANAEMSNVGSSLKSNLALLISRYVGMAAQVIGSILTISGMNQYGSSTSPDLDRIAGLTSLGGSLLSMGGGALSGAVTGFAMGGPLGAIAGGVMGLVSSIPSLISSINMLTPSLAREVELSTKRLNEAKQEESVSKGKEKDLSNAETKLSELEASAYKSTEAMAEYHEYMNLLAETYPELVSSIDEAGNSIIDLKDLELALANARKESADATLNALEEEVKNKKLLQENWLTLLDFDASGFTANNLYRLVTHDTDGYIGRGNTNEKALRVVLAYNNWARQTNANGQLNGMVLQLDYDLSGKGLRDPAQAFKYLTDSNYEGYFSAYYKDLYNGNKEYLDSISPDNYNASDAELDALMYSLDPETLKTRYINILKKFKEAAEKAGTNVSYNALTNLEINDLETDIKALDIDTLNSAIEHTKKIAGDYINVYDESINNIEGLIGDNKLNKELLTQLDETSRTTKKDYNKYKSLMANFIKRRYETKDSGPINWSSDSNQKLVKQNYDYWTKWLNTHEKNAEYLMNEFNINSFANEKDLREALSKKGGLEAQSSNISEEQRQMILSYVEDNAEALSEARERARNILRHSFTENNETPDYTSLVSNGAKLGLYEDKESENLAELTADMLNSFSDSWDAYNSLVELGYTVAADNFKTGLVTLYNAIGTSLTSEQLTSILPIIKELDLRDTQDLDTAIEQLTGMEGMGGLVTVLKSARNRLLNNVFALALEYAEKAKDVTKAVESVFSNMNKALSYTSIVEDALKILAHTKDKTLTFDKLVAWDDDLLSFVLTQDAMKEQLILALTEFNEDVSTLEANAKKEKDFINNLDLTNLNTKSLESVSLTSSEIEQLGIEGDLGAIAAWTEKKLTLLMSAAESEDIKTWLKDLNDNIDSITTNEIALLNSLFKNSAITALGSFDWSSIAEGTANETRTKENLTILLELAGVDPALIQEKVDSLYSAALSGNIDAMNEALSGTGYLISAELGKSIIASDISLYKTAIDEIRNKSQDSWSKGTNALISELKLEGEMLDDTNNLEATLLEALRTKLGDGAEAIQEYNDYLLTLLTESGFGNVASSLGLLEGGFTINEFNDYLKNLGINEHIDDYFNFATKQFNASINGIDLNNIFKYDELTNTFKIDVIRDMDSVISDLMIAYNITREKATQLYRETLDDKISTRLSNITAEDIGLASAGQLKSLGQAQAGDIILVDKLSETIQNKLADFITTDKDGVTKYIEVTSVEMLDSMLETLEDLLALGGLEIEERNAVQNIVSTIHSRTSKTNGLSGIIAKSIGESAAQAYATAFGQADNVGLAMRDLGFTFDEITNEWKAGATTIGLLQFKIAELAAQGADVKTINELNAILDSVLNLRAVDVNSAVTTIAQNWENISIDTLKLLANAHGKNYQDIISELKLTDNGDGTFKATPAALQALLKIPEITEETRKAIETLIASIVDTYLNSIKTASSLMTEGTTSQADITAFLQEYRRVMGKELSASAFSYDDLLDAWTLDPTIMREYMTELAGLLVEKGLLTKKLTEEYLANLINTLANAIDVSSFLDAENKSTSGLAYKTLKTSLVNYLKMAPKEITDSLVDSLFTGYGAGLKAGIKDMPDVAGAISTKMINLLSQGGSDAVSIMLAIADAQGVELSASDIENAWRSEVSQIEDAFDLLMYGPGSLVSGKAKAILEKLAAHGLASITEIDANNAVVNSITDIAAAYLEYYNQLAKSGEATLAALNEAQAKVLETRNGRAQEQMAIDALGDATGMTYTAFGEIFTNAGYELTDEIARQLDEAGIILSMGGNKMRISDFAAFARLMKWDFNSEEYISAFKTYNDSLIEINHKVESDIAAEINSLGDAKGGDWLNVTGFYNALIQGIEKQISQEREALGKTSGDISAEVTERFYAINDSLLAFGAYIEDGILKLDENANLAGIATVLKDQLKTTGLDMSMEIDSILDTIDNIIDTYISSIDAGINGSLSHQDAATLRRTAASYGVENLDFMETAEGLKLTNDSIFELYSSIRKINQLSAKKLLPGIKDLNSKYGDLGSAMREYEQQLKAGNVDTAKAIGDIITEYLSSPDSFDFTRGQNTTQDEIAKNIYESGYKAYNTMNAAKKTGTMAYDDFTSMMAQLYKTNPDAQVGTTGKTVRELYENRFGYIDLDSNGNAIFRIKEMGLDEKNIGSLQDMIINYMKTTIDASNNQLETYNNLRKAAESTALVVNKYDKGGKLSAEDIANIAKESTDLQSTLASIPGGQSIYDKLIGKEGELSDAEIERWGTFLKQFGETDFTLEDFTTQLGELLGDGYVLDMDANGKLTINIKPEYKFPDGTQLHGRAAAKWREAASKALNDDINLDQKTIDYKMGQYKVKFKVDIDAKTGAETVTYTVETKDDTYESSTEAGLRQALKDQETIVQELAESAISSSGEDEDTYSYTIKGKNLKVIYGKDNISVEWLGDANDDEGKDLAAATEEKLNSNFENLKDQVLNLKSDQVINATVSATGDYTIQWQEEPNAKILTINISSVEMFTMGPDVLKKVLNAISKCDSKVKVGLIDNATKGIENIRKFAEEVAAGDYTITFNIETDGSISDVDNGNVNNDGGGLKSDGGRLKSGGSNGGAAAKGNVALPHGTLMGELGPELVVSGGHYYVVGLNGAEMVDLPKDAIVFNHLLTASLLRNGSSTRGKAVTNATVAAGEAYASANEFELFNSDTSLVKSVKPKSDDAIVKSLASKLNDAIVKSLEPKLDDAISAVYANSAAVQDNTAITKKQAKELLSSDAIITNSNKHKAATVIGGVATEAINNNISSILALKKGPLNKTAAKMLLSNDKDTVKKSLVELTNKSIEEINTLVDSTWDLFQADSSVLTSATTLANTLNETAEGQEEWLQAVDDYLSTLETASNNMNNAADTMSDIADTTANIARVASHIDDELLHTGYKRKASTSDTDNGNNKKRKLNFSDATTSGGGHWETIIKGKAVDASSEDLKNADNAIKAVLTVISNLLSQGFENINLDDSAYDNLDKDLKAEMKEYIKRADASYRDFVALYAEAADLSTKEFNEKYFEAWQADIYNPGSSNEALEAAEGLTFFASGKIAGSSDDWTTLFGEYTDASELVEAGIIEWDSQLRLYVITSIDALKEYDTNLNAIDNLPAMLADDILDQFKDIQSKLQSSLEGTISNMDILNFKHQLELNGIDVDNLDFRETAEGLKLSEESAISIYDVLTKIDGLQADVTFEKLKENLELNNVNYKDAASINKRIFDLRSMIAELPANDARIKLYKAELKLAEQIRDMRIATEDESYKKMGSGISGGINNPINLVKDYTSITLLWSEGTASLEDMYNLMERINASAKDLNKTVKFGSLTLDGTEEGLTQAWQDLFLSGALKINENGEQMVDTNVLGLTPEALKASTDDLIARFDDERQAALKALTGAKAKASIKEAFDSLNISGYSQNDILNGSAYTEQFKADAINMLLKAASDNRLMDSLKNIAVGERTLYDVLTDAESGQNAVETAEQLTEALALITSYEGDSAEELERLKIAWENTDLDSIRKNIEDISNATTAYVGEIEKWFNYLRQIEKLTELINRAEKERSVIESGVLSKDGNAYFDSQIKSLALYKSEIAEVNAYMPEFLKSLELQWENVKTNGLDKIFTRNESTGAAQYETGILAALEQIFNIDKVTGKPNTSNASAQEAQLRALLGDETFDALSKYNSSGELIVQGSKTKDEYTAEKVLAIYDAILNAYGEINADALTIINADNTRNEALQGINTLELSMVDNLITLENKVLQAIEDVRQAEIDDAQKTRDAYKKSTDAYINGLRDMVNKEKQLHERDKDNLELVKLQRLRDILLRSGGSASEIANLNNEINDKQYDAYIQALEDLISSIEDANTAALERLDKLISLMEETLQYEKEHGMLWDDVYNIMSLGSDYIISFLEEYTTEWQSQSSAQLELTVKLASFEAAQWTKLYNKNGIAAIIAEYDDDETVAARADIIAGKIDEKVEEKLKEFQAEQEDISKSVISASSNEDNGSIGDAAFIDNTISANSSIGDAAFVDRSGSSIGDAAFIVTDELVKVLRDDMIGNNHNPLMNALLDSNEAYKNFVSSTYDSISNASNNSTIIEHAEVNVNVDKLANSYDASKAGDDIMKEMLSIARKTNAQNRVGR